MLRFFPSSPWYNTSPLDLCSAGIEILVPLPLHLQHMRQQGHNSQTRLLYQHRCRLSLQGLGRHGQMLLGQVLDLQLPHGQRHGILQPEQPQPLQLRKCLFELRCQIPQETLQAQWHLHEHPGPNLPSLIRKVTRLRRSQQEHHGQNPHDATGNPLLIITAKV